MVVVTAMALSQNGDNIAFRYFLFIMSDYNG